MTGKDFLNYKKPHFWTVLILLIILIFAGVVAVLDKEEPAEQVDVPPTEEVAVEVEEVPEEPKKTDSQIIIERFSAMDWDEVKKNAKQFGDDGWEKGIVILAELPNDKITLYGYNDEEYQLKGVAIDFDGNVNYFDWEYTSAKTYIQPEMYWNAGTNQLQITLNLHDGEGINAEELHVLMLHDTKTMEDFVLRSKDYLAEIQGRMDGTGTAIGEYVNIKLGNTMMLEFEPVKTVDGEEEILKLHQAVIYLKSSKDGYVFEIGDIGVEPEKRTAKIKIEGIEEEYTEIQYISAEGFSIWYPDYILEPYKIYNHDGFVVPGQGEDSQVKVLLVPEGDMKLTDSYLKEAAGNYKSSGEYKKVTISKIKTIKADDKNVKIKMIEVVHDDTADRFYIIEGKNSALLVTVSMTKESLKGMGTRITKMLQTVTFVK
jgi:hypothetical protein